MDRVHIARMGYSLLAATLICGSARLASANTIYVSPTGNDANAGTVDKPLHSVQKAADEAQPGDVIMLRDGVYREAITLKNGGTDGKPITFQSAPNEKAILKGSALVTGWTKQSAGIWKIENWKTNSQQLFADGQPLQQIGIQNKWNTVTFMPKRPMLPPVGKGLDDVKPGTFYYDKDSQTLYCMLADQSDPNSHVMEASVLDNVLDGAQASYVVLRDLSFMHSNNTAKGGNHGIVRIGGQGWLVEGCSFTYGDFAGISMSGDDHIVRHCNISNNGDSGISLNGSDVAHGYHWYADRKPMNILFEDLEIKGNNYRHFQDQWHAGGMKCVPCCRGVTIRRCNVSNNHGAGVWFDGGLGDNRIEDNLVADNTTGIFYEIAGPADGDPFGVLIKNNRVARSGNQGIYISGSNGAIVENNTCYQNRWDIVLHGMPRRVFGAQRILKNNVVRNNIVDGKYVDIVLFTGKDAENNAVDGNFYVNTKPGAASMGKGLSLTTKGYGNGVIRDLKVAREKGFEKDGLAGDPMWVNPDQLDFQLKPGSPATGKGWQPPKEAK